MITGHDIILRSFWSSIIQKISIIFSRMTFIIGNWSVNLYIIAVWELSFLKHTPYKSRFPGFKHWLELLIGFPAIYNWRGDGSFFKVSKIWSFSSRGRRESFWWLVLFEGDSVGYVLYKNKLFVDTMHGWYCGFYPQPHWEVPGTSDVIAVYTNS